MARLAIKGHATRGREVIELLEMLGGEDMYQLNARRKNYVYIIEEDKIISLLKIDQLLPEQFIVFTLEEFLEKYPYKVGDKVTLDKFPCTIKGMSWDCDDVIYYVQGADFSKGVYSKDKDLQPYKEETMEEIKIDIPKGYEFAGVDDDNCQVVFTKIKPKYPKTYEECCKVMDYALKGETIVGYKASLLRSFQKLLVCRDAYWKIAGEWKPNWVNTSFYSIGSSYGVVSKRMVIGSGILVFPTEEMRDAFHENFKELIEQCKELL